MIMGRIICSTSVKTGGTTPAGACKECIRFRVPCEGKRRVCAPMKAENSHG